MLDLLEEPFASTGAARSEQSFSTTEPWALADFGRHTLARGWWVFECEGQGEVSTIELRLVSPEDTLMAFSLSRTEHGRAMFPADRAFTVELMISPWPTNITLSKLRLRQMSKGEEAKLAGAMISRLARSDKPLSKITHVAARAFGGRSLRVQTPAPSVQSVLMQMPGLSPDPGFRVHRQGDIAAVTLADDALHPRAMEIVAAKLEREAHLQAIYADVAEAGVIWPTPQWDPDLVSNGGTLHAPVFFRGDAEASNPWPRVEALSNSQGAVGHIALPLSIRSAPRSQRIENPPAPILPRVPSVSIVVPTRNRVDLLKLCLSALAQRTDYPKLEIVIVDNGADARALAEAIELVAGAIAVRTIKNLGAFNFSRLINEGVRETEGEIVLLMNDDVEAIEQGWLHRMAASAMLPDVGCVGARLLYPNGTIQHAGVMLGLSGVCGHLWKGLGEAEAAMIPQIVLPGGRMAVTGACLAVKRDTFDRAGGLDEESFGVAFNDIDFCLRVRQMGLRTMYRGDAVLIHHESQSRGLDDANRLRRKRLARETRLFLDRWSTLLKQDPFGSPAYDLTVESGEVHPSLRWA